MRYALVRDISPRLHACELTHMDRDAIDVDLARRQHAEYREALETLGCHVIMLPADDDLPDCAFVEDPAVVLNGLAIMTRPGAKSRRPEGDIVEKALAPHRRIERIVHPGTLEGGDVLVIGKTIYVGRSTRTNDDGIAQLAALVEHAGYAVKPVEVPGCLHLKTGATLVAPDKVVANRAWIDADAFEDIELIDVDPDEPFAANALRIDGAVVHPDLYPRTRETLESHGIEVLPVPFSELAKAEAGVTCCSIIFEADWKPRLVE